MLGHCSPAPGHQWHFECVDITFPVRPGRGPVTQERSKECLKMSVRTRRKFSRASPVRSNRYGYRHHILLNVVQWREESDDDKSEGVVAQHPPASKNMNILPSMAFKYCKPCAITERYEISTHQGAHRYRGWSRHPGRWHKANCWKGHGAPVSCRMSDASESYPSYSPEYG